MPPNRASNIKRRILQADAGLIRAIGYLADVYITIKPQHSDIAAALLTHIQYLDNTRRSYSQLYRTWWSGNANKLWQPDDLAEAMRQAQIVPDPSTARKQRQA
ncbi:unnamed protein product [marine sediment metagenome]|uniref:Uncharacterized protein n=1 Tax=marine sediment metagenome TaxID=412755 RepID=X1T218_9ZZZZ